MKINLNDQECQNVRVALRSLMKAPEVNELAMKQLLVLSDKFATEPVEPPKVDKK